ncbi:D-alanyl-D-alanine carboxypeptidase family protein [Oryzobacter sp. R7]|uniref:D-alanyl-D-alanine carboxypeptidase family protein n=1 Tax=Oryzobacter faecalis TaxID=3388656 RepID=UPI00398CE602
MPRAAVLVAAGVAAAALAGGGVALVAGSEEDERRAAPRTTSPTAVPTSPSPSPTPSPTPTTAPGPRAGDTPTVRRVRAGDRFALSATAARTAVPRQGTATVVYLVADDELALGWAAVPGAAARGGAVLLTPGDRLPSGTAKELARLGPDEVVVVGDEDAVSSRVEDAARRVAPVTRVDEDDPVVAARAVTRAAFTTSAAAWVVSAERTTDLAAAAATAAARRAPLVVVGEGARSLPAADADLLRALGVAQATVVGGTGTVAEGVATGLTAALGAGGVRRVEGADRFVLAARVHERAWDGATAAAAVVVNPARSTDAFTGSVLAGHAAAPLYWSFPHCLPGASRDGVLAPTVADVTVVGGERSVRSLVDGLVPCRSTEDPTSAWVLVNKRNGLSPKGFVPDDLEVVPMDHNGGHRLAEDAAEALAAMAAGSRVAGAGTLGIDTAFRSRETQDALYDKYLARRGRTWTDRWYLRPGYSEHQTGLAVDLLPIGRSNCTINDCIDETPQGVWLARNSWRYGFILRYERGYTGTTGVGFEPWHFRYVGKELARAYHDGGWHTLEDFLGRPAAPTY